MVNWNAFERIAVVAFAFLTATASVVVAVVAWLALQEARREWLIVPAPENLKGKLLDGSVRLSWDTPRVHADMVRSINVLQWSNSEPWGVMQNLKSLPPDVKFHTVPACEDLHESSIRICTYRLQMIAWNERAGTLSRMVVCTREKCGYVPSSIGEIVWQDEYD